ncbi:MAG: TIGR04255 family protein, partial [Candidatus Hydrogenedentes bacterium]|nr:TIGR04255 family protein [Candidatus Hydrogenedentota bacterium]
MKRTLDPLFLPRSPLVLVIAQVRISTILKMEDYVPDVQEALRKKGYPEYKYEEGAEVTVSGNQIISKRTQRWFFLNASNTDAVILSTDFVALSTTEYKKFEDFSSSLEDVLACINGVV